nr:hypothetical protein [Acidithiobacillus montserratensis]
MAVAVLALAGCGQEPLHSAKYYETHKAELKSELASCKPMLAALRSTKEGQWKLLKGIHDKNHKIMNCMAAENANDVLHPENLWGGMAAPINPNVMP